MSKHASFEVAIVGGGPAGLMAAEAMTAEQPDRPIKITIYDRMPSLARRFLMAGRGGLNLTHSETQGDLLGRYGLRRMALTPAIEAFPPDAVRTWCEALGQPTFVGSSGRVFPTAMKASPLLRAWLQRLGACGVRVRIRHRWRGWNDDGQLRFETPEGPVDVYADATVLALGGASWPGLGADPAWVDRLLAAGISVSPLVAANCGFRVSWSQTFRDRYEGQPLKRIALRCGPDSVRGEALVTATGIEGGAVYALSARLREAIATDESATLLIDLRPDDESGELATQLNRPHRKQSLSSFLRKSVRLSPVAIGLLQEVVRDRGGKLGDLPAADLAHLIKAVPIRLAGTASIDRAISSAGGVAFEDLDANFMLRRLPGVFVAGEMLDWDAPTGGYLLQASFATGAAAGNGAARWLAARHRTG